MLQLFNPKGGSDISKMEGLFLDMYDRKVEMLNRYLEMRFNGLKKCNNKDRGRVLRKMGVSGLQREVVSVIFQGEYLLGVDGNRISKGLVMRDKPMTIDYETPILLSSYFDFIIHQGVFSLRVPGGVEVIEHDIFEGGLEVSPHLKLGFDRVFARVLEGEFYLDFHYPGFHKVLISLNK